jgi:hypothetical protein
VAFLKEDSLKLYKALQMLDMALKKNPKNANDAVIQLKSNKQSNGNLDIKMRDIIKAVVNENDIVATLRIIKPIKYTHKSI